jgi:hypothetical protein
MPVVDPVVCQHCLGLRGQGEERQRAFPKEWIAVVVQLTMLVVKSQQSLMYLRPNCLPFSISAAVGKSLRSFKRLPGRFPRSIIAASLVALRIKSGRLVKLPRASASRTAFISRFRGRLSADKRRFASGVAERGSGVGIFGSIGLTSPLLPADTGFDS